MVEIRPYIDSDYPEVEQNLKEGELYDAVWDRRENIKKMIKMDPESILVAVENGHVIGSVYVIALGWEALMFRLAVRKAYRNKGIGGKLLKEVEDRVRQRGVREIAFFVDAGDSELQEFYRKRGYAIDGKYVVMHRKI